MRVGKSRCILPQRVPERLRNSRYAGRGAKQDNQLADRLGVIQEDQIARQLQRLLSAGDGDKRIAVAVASDP